MIRWMMVAALAAMTMAASAQDCCEKKVVAQVKQEKECCASKQADDREAAFMAEARRMMLAAEKGQGAEECCQSTAEKPMAKGDPGCCNAPGAPAKFKVFIAGEGYKFFGCEDSAGQGREALLAGGKRVGKVQKVTGNAKI